jgi:zinc transporter
MIAGGAAHPSPRIEIPMNAFDTSTLAPADPIAEPRQFGIVPGLIWAFRIHDDGKADPLPADQPIDNARQGWVWLHLDLANGLTCEWLRSAGLPETAITTMLSRDRHQQLHATDAVIYGIFADLVRNLDGVSDEVGHLRFIMTERLLISGRHHALCAVEAARTTIESGTYRLPDSAGLLELIVDHVADGIDTIADGLETELDQIENDLAARTGVWARNTLSRLRRTSVRLHRQLSGLRAVFHRLERQGIEGANPKLRLRAGKIAQRLDDLDHGILEIRERGYRLQEEVSAARTEETNRHLHILSILTTLLLPATLVTGIFGMNTKGLPFTENESGFLWSMAIAVGSSLVAYLAMLWIGILKRRA